MVNDYKEIKIIDLFCGVGGFSKGFELAGYNIVAGIDNNEKLKETFIFNHQNSRFIQHDLLKGVSEDFKKGDIDFIIGSPPCQGFSDARGNRDSKSIFHELRNSLPIRYIDWIDMLKPEIALMENVSGMATIKAGSRLFLEEIRDNILNIGYNIRIGLLNSSYYGVPQERIRVFCLIYKDLYKRILDPLPFPLPKHIPKKFKRRKPRKKKIDIWYFEETEKKFFPELNERQKIYTVGDILLDLPGQISDSGLVNYTTNKNLNELQRFLRSKDPDKVSLHCVLKEPTEKEKLILKNISEGKIYRSSRFGDRYIGAWDLYKSVLQPNERFLLMFMCRFRTREDVKTTKGAYTEGYLLESLFDTYENMIEMMVKNKYITNEEAIQWNESLIKGKLPDPYNTLKILEQDKWLRTKYIKNEKTYDINTKSGIRPLYLRLHRDYPSRTIMTTSFRVRELVHPTIDRPITFREGARIQTFPDDFEFFGTPVEIATMIGNAVPSLLAFELAKYYKFILQNIKNGKMENLLEKYTDFTTKLITDYT